VTCQRPAPPAGPVRLMDPESSLCSSPRATPPPAPCVRTPHQSLHVRPGTVALNLMINRCRLKTTVLAAVGLLGCLNAAQTRHAGAGGGLVLVTGGKPTAVIVVPERPDATETAAANKLQDYIRKASGAELPVMSESAAAAPGQVRVFIGRTARAAERGIDASRLEPEQFRILAAGNEIILAGAPPGATRIGGTSESAPLI
jgi:hypothetical protein